VPGSARASAGRGGVGNSSISELDLFNAYRFVGQRPKPKTSRIGHISFGMKQAGKPSAGNPHAGFDVAGAGNRLTARLVRHSQRKRGGTC